MSRTVVVGGGAAGVLAAIHLLREGAPGDRVDLIAGTSGGAHGTRLGSGVAYRTDDERHLLNVPANRMSAYPGDSDDFARWAGVGGEAFVARRRYGEYLRAALEDERADAGGVTLCVRDAEAVDVDHVGVTLSSGEFVEADGVVLALGHATPAPMPGVSAAAAATQRYIPDPWADAVLDTVVEGSRAVILGTALTFVDVVLSLTGRLSNLSIVGVSRRGLLPHTHVAREHDAPSLDAMVAQHGGALNPLMRAFVAQARAAGPQWRMVFDGMRPHTSTQWAAMSPIDKRRFVRHVLPYWDNHRHRMAPDVGSSIAALQAAGTIAVRKGRVASIDVSDGGLRTRLRNGETLQSDYVIRCTGAGGRHGPSSSALLGNLIRRGLRIDPYGFGLVADPDGRVHVDDPHVLPMYVIGPPRRGSEWESTAIPEIRCQALAVARTVLGLRD